MDIKKTLKEFPYMPTFVWIFKKTWWIFYKLVKFTLIFCIELAGSGGKQTNSQNENIFTNYRSDDEFIGRNAYGHRSDSFDENERYD